MIEIIVIIINFASLVNQYSIYEIHYSYITVFIPRYLLFYCKTNNKFCK